MGYVIVVNGSEITTRATFAQASLAAAKLIIAYPAAKVEIVTR